MARSPNVGFHIPDLNDSDQELSDDADESIPLTGINSAAPTDERPENWDMFEDPPPPISSFSEDSDKFGQHILKFAKLLTYLLTFAIVLGCGLIAKSLMLLMAAQLKPGRVTDLCPAVNRSVLNAKTTYTVETNPYENVAWAWALFFAFIVPEVETMLRSFRMCFFKGFVTKFYEKDPEIPEKPEEVACRRYLDLLVVAFFEMCHSAGVAVLIYAVLPDLDSIKGAMLTNCVSVLPGVLGMLSRTDEDPNRPAKLTMDIVAIMFQLTGFVVWPLILSFQSDAALLPAWAIPFALFLTSFGWWENYVDTKSSWGFVRFLGGVKRRLWKTRYVIYFVVPVLKVCVYFVVMVVVMGLRLDDFGIVFDIRFGEKAVSLNATETRIPLQDESVLPGSSMADIVPLQEPTPIDQNGNTPVYFFLAQMLAAYLCYIFSKFVCKISMQEFSFSLPVTLVVPTTVCTLILMCGARTENPCAYPNVFGYVFWTYDQGTSVFDFFVADFSLLWFLWLLSQTWITLHIWTPKREPLAKTEKMFVTPMYDSLLIDQSLVMNRRRNELANKDNKKMAADDKEDVKLAPGFAAFDDIQESDHTTRIYSCATMWHENSEEMMEFLKSVLRVDEDQSARRLARNFLRMKDPDYYEFETHVFFDDAFELPDPEADYCVVNGFVRELLGCMDEAASYIHQTIMHLRPPTRYPTPYGGRLVWTLPGKTKFIVHLKDKQKIRHKKRWSQVMYMYYLLGFKLMDQDSLSLKRKEVIAENTYLLALDGDIDFTARSVRMLVDLMKKDTNLGAACGRIHPVGSGMMVWYQKFEYAIGHWLQKATEHMIGCVLCSPGCFSLFRGRALMDDSVMRKYTTVSNRARHYVQYDQGEDRWLCTLLLKRGYRVEYSAASDAYTHAPEGFGEFYNQRRRWVPSTLANIMDVLEDYKITVKINDNISMLYILYQMMLMLGTVVGPGTIFLMLVGALSAAFGMSNGWALVLNLIPLLAFMITCFFAKSATQIKLAYVLTAIYALLMCAVAVALALNIMEEGLLTPSSLFLFATAASFIITAMLHPQEFWCLPTGLVYYLVVPSMYLLLQIYSCYNLNDVSWGTRDVPVKKSKEELEREKKELEEAEKKQAQTGWMASLTGNGQGDSGMAGFFRKMCCYKGYMSEHILRSVDSLKKQLDRMEAHLGMAPTTQRRRSTMTPRGSNRSSDLHVETVAHADPVYSDEESQASATKDERNDLINPYWMEDKNVFGKLGHKDASGGHTDGQVEFLTKQEVTFWQDLIERYLKPLDKNKDSEAKAKQELLDLRNMAVFSFTMINAIFIVIIFLMQANQDVLYVNWPIGVKNNITYVYSEDMSTQIEIAQDFVHLEPIGFLFVIFFGCVMAVQFTAMLFHRIATFSQIISSIDISCGNKEKQRMTMEGNVEMSASTAVNYAKKLQKISDPQNSEVGESVATDFSSRRRTMANIASSRAKPAVVSLDDAFLKRVGGSMSGDPSNEELNRRRSTVMALVESNRRMSMRRPSLRGISFSNGTIAEES
ncbi:chitin synthase chs-2 isoform X2 [Hyalella azteca]|uniref:chitin synthase n=1 Tax=Hyalella azteca TaxID=294128 RepID=A0A979FRE6_HYAAZ|nr:chitin synthase chs-2 isoform X2 [Hyalella azteca]